MKELRPSSREYAICFVTVVLYCYASFLLADNANALINPEDEIKDLCKIV